MPRSFHRWLLLYCMWIMVFKGCRSFFLRHTETGKCVTASEELVYDIPAYAKPYFVVMTDNCLNGSAQFRYPNTELLQNIEKGGTLVSSPNDEYDSRWAVYKGKKKAAKKYQNKTEHRLKQTAAGSLSFYSKTNPVCAEANSSSKYLLRKSYCDTKKQDFTFGSVTAFNGKMEKVHCSPKQLMMVKSADYGDFDDNSKFIQNAKIDTQCSQLTNCQVKSRCGGKRSCDLTIDDNFLVPKYCSNTSKQIYTKYTCVDKPFFITGPNVRLSQSPNEGFIEIKDGPTWRKVKEENWDEDRQKMLCQHFGFEENTNTGSIAIGQNITTKQNITTGHLICYKAQPNSEISCCIYLEPFTTTPVTTIPYVTCGKLCDRPLLKNVTMFPDAVFSGRGEASDYHQARFYGDGWCSSGSTTDYLLIDLKNDYHITQAVTMGDKNQTKWSNSYSLKYSHTETLVDSSTEVNIIGNQNGYQASTTSLDIYNARFIKIQSVVNTNFCLRIELCGEVQSPAPVQNFTAKPSNFSVNLSWIIPEAKVFSYSTHFIVYLNDTMSDGIRIVRISRVNYGNEFVLHGLKPVTEYTVGIQAQDSSSKNATIVYQNFKTKEAVPSGPPRNVTVNSRTSDSLGISWEAPHKHLWNGKLTGYQVCYSSVTGENGNCLHESSVLSLKIPNLQPSTKYFVTVAASTKIGYGNKSLAISKITNGEPINPVAISYSSLNITLAKQEDTIKEMMVIVQIAPETTPVEDIQTNVLRPYPTDTQDPYVAAYFKADLPLTFIIGDGREYNSEDGNYTNQPLKQDTSYIVFLRFFESQDSYYSTEWSSSVKTMIKPPAPEVNITSSSMTNYTVTWSSSLPDQQIFHRYYIDITYTPSNGSSTKRNVPDSKITSHNLPVELNKAYTFAIQVETNAGKSDTTSKSWRTPSEPSASPQKKENGYAVILKKPEEENITTVALIMLQQLEKSHGNVPLPEQLELKRSPPEDKEANNVAFIVEEFPIEKFENGNLEILLQASANAKRRKRREIDVVKVSLVPNATYRITQRNEDTKNKSYWSYWSEPFVNRVIVDPRKPVTTTPTGINTTTPTSRIGSSSAKIAADTGEKSNVGAIVGAIFAVVVIIIALVLAVIYFKRRRSLQRYSQKDSVEDLDEMAGIENGGKDGHDGNKPEDRPANEDIYSNETGFVEETEHPAVPVAEFAHYVNEMKARENYAFQGEYDELPANRNTSWDAAKRSFNKQKNRYGNIVTYDHCRVVLSGDTNEDYINASYIDGIKRNSYIATQGPTKHTLEDMWRMVWEQNTYSVVMVTSLVELGKPKCAKYWPDSGTQTYGDIEVTLVKVEEFADHVTHTLQLTKDGEEREVKHYYFQSWPDHGVPKYPTPLLAFRRHYRTQHLEQSGPIVVHCSAGVGRTGVFLAIDMILDKLEKGVIDSIDVFGTVCAMRERRMNMVQTLEQYIFIHEAILETILCGMNEVDSSRIQMEVKNLAQVQASGMTGFQEKFKRLGEVSPKLSNEECFSGLLEENYPKNRNKNVHPAECSRVALQYIDGEANSDYINAVFVHGYLGRNYFIATQSPLPNTINDFWRLVHSQKTSTIALLNNVKDGTSFPRFWPTSRGVPTQYGSLTVQLDSEGESNGIWTRKFIISSSPDLSDGHVVSMFQYTKWPDHRVPPNGNAIITLTSLVEKSRQSHGEGPVIVACSDGAGRTGTYIAISNLLERMKIEQAMDVFQSIKIIRGTRPQFVENAEQYQFCYTAVMAYLDAFSEYSNFE